MDTTCPIKEMKIKSSRTKFIIKTFTSTRVAKILPKLELQDQQLWDILSSTNTNLHAHEVVGSLWVWTPIISISSSSYIQSTKNKIAHFFFFRKWSWSSSCLSCTSLLEFLFALLLLFFCSERLCESLFSFVFLLGHVFTSPSSKFFLVVLVCTKFQKFASLFPNFLITTCVLTA